MSAASSLPPAPIIQVGSILDDKYVLVRRIGSGTVGSVFEAEQRDLGKRVAVKVLHDALSSDLRQRFLDEARAAASIAHPNIVDVLDYGVSADGRGYLVMELVEGGALDQLLGQGALPVREACDLTLGILHALGAAHARGIVHRDLRPANVRFDRTTRAVKLLDLGIGCAAARQSPPEDAAATDAIRYQPPEQLDGAELDERADIYAIGAMLYEMLAGLPVPSLTRRGDERSILDVNPTLPLDLARSVSRALAADRQQRFATAYDFAWALAPLASATARTLLESFPGRFEAPSAVIKKRMDGAGFRALGELDLSEPAIPRHPAPPRFEDLAGAPPAPLPVPVTPANPAAVRQQPRALRWYRGPGMGALVGALFGSGVGVLIAWWIGLI